MITGYLHKKLFRGKGKPFARHPYKQRRTFAAHENPYLPPMEKKGCLDYCGHWRDVLFWLLRHHLTRTLHSIKTEHPTQLRLIHERSLVGQNAGNTLEERKLLIGCKRGWRSYER